MAVIQTILVPMEIVNDEFVTIAKLYFENGTKVDNGNLLVDISTSKAVFSMESEHDGFVEYLCEEGEDVEIGKLIINIHDKELLKKDLAKASKNKEDSEITTKFSKPALECIKKNKIDKSIFAVKDFVSLDDVNQYLEGIKSKNKESKEVVKEPKFKTRHEDPGLEKEELSKINKLKNAEIEALSYVQKAGLNSVVNVYVDVGNMSDTSSSYLERYQYSFLTIIVYEVSRLLSKYKEFNAYYIDGNVAHYKDIQVGLAVDVDDGLKVLRVSDANSKTLEQLETEIFDLINRYLEKTLTNNDVLSTTFTITDLSSHNVGFFTPLINKKQSAVLGISSIDEKLKRCILTLTFDHRVSEGRRASLFLNDLKERIESYWKNKSSDDKNNQNIITSAVKCHKCLKSLEEDERMKGIGLIKIVNHKGQEVLVCQTCLDRWQ